ncbi:hypothetical protein ACHAXT_005298 [Thalassiosira profunda]
MAPNLPTCRPSTLCVRNLGADAKLPSDKEIRKHCEIEYDEDECQITDERLKRAKGACAFQDRSTCRLTAQELRGLRKEQTAIRTTLGLGSTPRGAASMVGGAIGGKVKRVSKGISTRGLSIKEQMQKALSLVDEEEEGAEEEVEAVSGEEVEVAGETKVEETAASAPPQDTGETCKSRTGETCKNIRDLKAQLMTAKVRARLDQKDDGVLGVQGTRSMLMTRGNSIRGNKFAEYNLRMNHRLIGSIDEDGALEEEEEKKEIDLEDLSYVRKPNLARIIEEYEAMRHHPKYNLKQVILSRRFHLYAHRFGNSQYQRTLVYPTMPQPPEMFAQPEACPWLTNTVITCGECKEQKGTADGVTEKQRTTHGHRFIIAADTQFGILMDGFASECLGLQSLGFFFASFIADNTCFAVDFPNWTQEIEISRKCVKQINDMCGKDRPKYVVVCGDLVDTESSFSGAIASWKKVMSGWERNLVYEQQVKDFKRVWAGLNPDIALVCLCGNHDVGNKPTRASIKRWTSSFGDDYLSFWCNGTFNLCLNNCLFSNPTGATDLFDEQLEWMEERLQYARDNDATHIFVYGHFPWFMKSEDEADDYLTSYSAAPPGWGPPGSSFADSYFTIPLEQRKIAMKLFKQYEVTACFSGHFHQNVVAKTSWGMDMIVTGPLSMNLNSEISEELANGETNGIGMRVVDVGEKAQFTHKWMLLDNEEELYENALQRCIRQSAAEVDETPVRQNSLFDTASEVEGKR